MRYLIINIANKKKLLKTDVPCPVRHAYFIIPEPVNNYSIIKSFIVEFINVLFLADI